MIEFNANRRNGFRWKLLSTVSAMALLEAVCLPSNAKAEDATLGNPPVWIELGGQFERVGGGQVPFAPPFVNSIVQGGLSNPTAIEKVLGDSIGGEGKISFESPGSDWVFSASVRYGRAQGHKSTTEKTTPVTQIGYRIFQFTDHQKYFVKKVKPKADRFSNTNASNSEYHTMLDFMAGKDIGLGFFGNNATSTVSAGVRFAQFASRSADHMAANPDFNFVHYHKYRSFGTVSVVDDGFGQRWHNFDSVENSVRSFLGVGPSISWNASVPFVGSQQDGELTIDVGANAAVLFGRQKTKTHHQTNGSYVYYSEHGRQETHYQNPPVDNSRTRLVTVPNVGGVAGISYRIQDFKMSIGYRGDFFFGAIDDGIDVRHSAQRNFSGPYASFSVGIGD